VTGQATFEESSLKPSSPQWGDGSVSLYCDAEFAYYYFRQRMDVRGTIVKNGVTLNVRGIGRFDHQWGFQPAYQAAQSDYLQFSLDDGRDGSSASYASHRTARPPRRSSFPGSS